jgi:penicillin amidase
MKKLALLFLLACSGPVAPATGTTDVLTDEHGWPHIFAPTLRDAAVAEGYVMARDRLTQMELFRRTASGRLAERFGAISDQFLANDITMRTIGLRRIAEQLWAQTPDGRTRDMLEGYAEGVNRYIHEQHPVPRGGEILLANVEDWTPVDSLAVLRFMELNLSFNADQEIACTALHETQPKLFAQLMPFAPPSPAATVPDFYAPKHKQPTSQPEHARKPLGALKDVLATLHRVLPAERRLGVGTNAWAIVGANGNALLANDPHLPLIAPSILWGVHFAVEGGPDVTGVAFPGVPGVVFGHNAFVAWGITNAMFDQMDVYDEDLKGGAALFNGQRVPLETRVEHIPNGLGGTFDLTVETVPHHGPILKRTGDRGLSVRWVAAEMSHEVDGLIALMYATDTLTAQLAVRPIEVPAMGFVFADRAANIAFRATGRVPIRAPGAMTWDPVKNPNGTMPAWVLPGTGEAEWIGWLDPDQLPATTGRFVASANNDLAGLSADGNPFDAPVYLGYAWSEGYRAERITERLEAMTAPTLDDMRALQADNVMLVAKRLTPMFLDVQVPAELRSLQDTLRGWDYGTPVDSIAASVFHAWLERTLELALSDEGPTLAPSQRLRALLANPDRFWDDTRTPQVETRDDILIAALRQASADLGTPVPPWGKLHTVRFASALPHYSLALGADLAIPPHDEPAFQHGGGIDTIDQGWPELHDNDFTYMQAAARRFLVEMTPDGPHAFDALPGGESGDLSSPHFRDQADAWNADQPFQLWRSRDEVEAHAQNRERL